MSNRTATFVRNLRTEHDAHGSLVQHLYHLSDPVLFEAFTNLNPDGEWVQTDFVVASASHIAYDGRVLVNETYLFPADADGNILDWVELPGSQAGTLDHSKVLMEAGYTLAL